MIEEVPEKVLIEYQKAQDSAEHYNTMIWILTPVLLGFSISILYLIFSNNYNPIFNIFLLIFGSFSLFYFSLLIESANEKKLHKYRICKKIEKDYKFYGNNRGIERLYLAKNIIFNGMTLLRIAKIVLLFVYIFSLLFFIFGWSLPESSNAALVPGIFTIVAIILALILEALYKLNCPTK